MAPRKRVILVPPARRKLEPGDIAKIIASIDAWSDETIISWSGLVAHVEALVGYRWTRQALERHPSIKTAYQMRRDGLRTTRKTAPIDPAEVLLRRQVDALRAEILALKATLVSYEERFIRHEYNAHTRSMTPAELNKPLPPIDRGQTDV